MNHTSMQETNNETPSGQTHRRSIRLKGHDYTQPDACFVTICTRDRECLFDHMVNGEMRLNEAGHAAQQCWMDIPDHFPQVVLDEAIIMPNHIHGIIVIHRRGEASAIPPKCPRNNHDRMLRPYNNARTAPSQDRCPRPCRISNPSPRGK
jgi:REP element-mobilizing transposase RayT